MSKSLTRQPSRRPFAGLTGEQAGQMFTGHAVRGCALGDRHLTAQAGTQPGHRRVHQRIDSTRDRFG